MNSVTVDTVQINGSDWPLLPLSGAFTLKMSVVVPWAFHLAGLPSAPWRYCNAIIAGLSLLMTFARVPLYRAIRQFSLPRAVVICMQLCVSSRYSTVV